VATIEMGRKLVCGSAPFWGGVCVPICHKVAWAEVYLRTKWHLDPSSRLATTDIGRKLRVWVPIYHNMATAEAYLHAKFHRDPSIRLATLHQRSGVTSAFGARGRSNKVRPLESPHVSLTSTVRFVSNIPLRLREAAITMLLCNFRLTVCS